MYNDECCSINCKIIEKGKRNDLYENKLAKVSCTLLFKSKKASIEATTSH